MLWRMPPSSGLLRKMPWGVRLWGKNLFGAQYYRFETAGTLNDTCSPAPPRTYGMTFEFVLQRDLI